jgi:hypothetical protein
MGFALTRKKELSAEELSAVGFFGGCRTTVRH